MFCLWFGLEPKFQKRDLVKTRQKLAFTLSQGIPPLWISDCCLSVQQATPVDTASVTLFLSVLSTGLGIREAGQGTQIQYSSASLCLSRV